MTNSLPTDDDALWQHLREQLGRGDWTPYYNDLATVRRIRSILVSQLNDLNTSLARATSEATTKEQECRRMGPAGKAEWFEWKARQEQWRTSARRFKQVLERRASEVRRAERVLLDSGAHTDVDHHRHRVIVRILALAIDRHRRDVDDDDYEPTDADRRLWSILTQLYVPNATGDRSLAELIQSGEWFEGT